MGIIALAGEAAETGVVMLVYLDEAYERRVGKGRMTTAHDLREVLWKSCLAGAAQDDDRNYHHGRVAPSGKEWG